MKSCRSETTQIKIEGGNILRSTDGTSFTTVYEHHSLPERPWIYEKLGDLFYCGNNVWVVAACVVSMSDVPGALSNGDPFILSSDDDGVSWTAHPDWTECSISSYSGSL